MTPSARREKPMPNNKAMQADALKRSDLFQNVSPEIIDRVLEQAQPRALARSEVLLAPEVANEQLYILLSGSLSVHFGAADSPAIRELKPGVCVGELSVIDENNPSAYVIASEPCTLLAIHRDLILQLIDDANPLARNMLRVIAHWMRANTYQILNDRQHIWELYDHVHYDALTRLYNRRWLENTLPHLLEQALKNEQPLCLLMLDIDHFKQINDTHGHAVGDQALIAMGHVLHSAIRPYDFAARYGGDEFIVLLPNTTLEESRGVAERILEASARASDLPEQLGHLATSIGIAVSGKDCASPASLIAEADIQLYRAKKLGRNRACWHGDEPAL